MTTTGMQLRNRGIEYECEPKTGGEASSPTNPAASDAAAGTLAGAFDVENWLRVMIIGTLSWPTFS
jgi:hypothetical protein